LMGGCAGVCFLVLLFSCCCASSICNIPKVHQMPLEVFEQQYKDKHPVILSEVAHNELFRNLTAKDSLLSSWGRSSIVLSSSNAFSYEKMSMTLEEYVDEWVVDVDMSDLLVDDAESIFYHFGDNNYTEWDELFQEYHVPYQYDGSLSFGVGGNGSGVPFHVHGPVFAEVLHGKKRWLLYPPGDEPPAFAPDKTSYYWISNVYPELEQRKPLECVLSTDEVLYIPADWWHATLNFDCFCVFVSVFV